MHLTRARKCFCLLQRSAEMKTKEQQKEQGKQMLLNAVAASGNLQALKRYYFKLGVNEVKRW